MQTLMTRQQAKQKLRLISEIGIVAVLGKVPRKLRRGAGRQFANEAYRQTQLLPRKNLKVNQQVMDWIIREYAALGAKSAAETNPETDPVQVLPAGGSEDAGSGGESNLL